MLEDGWLGGRRAPNDTGGVEEGVDNRGGVGMIGSQHLTDISETYITPARVPF